MSKIGYLTIAYTVIWAAVLFYLLRLGVMRRNLEKKLSSVEERLKGREQD
ncbi:MAG: CcmD family protein [Deltaproteobacteria bacterium]|nr:CcmD family protein [Deltaproteobacteria bacterium]